MVDILKKDLKFLSVYFKKWKNLVGNLGERRTEGWEQKGDVWTWARTWIAEGGSLMDMDMLYMDMSSMWPTPRQKLNDEQWALLYSKDILMDNYKAAENQNFYENINISSEIICMWHNIAIKNKLKKLFEFMGLNLKKMQ